MFQRYSSYFPYEWKTIDSRFLPHYSPYFNSNKHCLLPRVKTMSNLTNRVCCTPKRFSYLYLRTVILLFRMKKVTFVYRQRWLFSMISVPCGTGDISSIWYRTVVRWYMPAAYEERILYHACEASIIIRPAVYHIASAIYHWKAQRPRQPEWVVGGAFCVRVKNSYFCGIICSINKNRSNR